MIESTAVPIINLVRPKAPRAAVTLSSKGVASMIGRFKLKRRVITSADRVVRRVPII